MNKCSMVIEANGKRISTPINFGLTEDEIKTLFPYLREYTRTTLTKPADDARYSYLWYGNTEASLLDIAVRFAVDIVIRDINVSLSSKLPRRREGENTMSVNNQYSTNQCTVIIRVDGEEIVVPMNFGLTEEDVKKLYPYLLEMTNAKITNPAVDFAKKAKMGICNGKPISTLKPGEYEAVEKKVMEQSKFWYDRHEASLLTIATRFAVDIKLKGIDELAEKFETPIANNDVL